MRSLVATVASAVLVLAACGDDGAPDARPTPPGSTTASTAAGSSGAAPTDDPTDPCSRLSDETVSEAAGLPVAVGPAETVGTRTVCSRVRDADDPLDLSWSIRPTDDSLAEAVDVERDGLSPVDVRLGDDAVPAARLVGEVAGYPIGRVVTVLGADLLVVDAVLTGLEADESPLTPTDLGRIATRVAEEYVAAG